MKTLLLALLMLAMLAGAALFGLWFAVGVPADGVQLIINDHAVDLHAAERLACRGGRPGDAVRAARRRRVVPLALLFAGAAAVAGAGAVALVLGAVLGVGALAMAPLAAAAAAAVVAVAALAAQRDAGGAARHYIDA